MEVHALKHMDQVKSNKFRMILLGEGSVEAAKAEHFSDGTFDGKGIALGSLYIDTTTFKKSIYTESTNSWKTEG